MKLTTAEQMKELDRQAIEERGIPSIDLMERAAAGVAEAALALLPKRPGKCRGAALCGAGNNCGDGIAAARLLFLKGLKVRAFLVGDYEKLTPDALEETRRLSECGVELERFDPADESQRAWVLGCDVVIDALFGVGLSRPIGAGTPFAAAVDWMNERCGAPVHGRHLRQDAGAGHPQHGPGQHPRHGGDRQDHPGHHDEEGRLNVCACVLQSRPAGNSRRAVFFRG